MRAARTKVKSIVEMAAINLHLRFGKPTFLPRSIFRKATYTKFHSVIKLLRLPYQAFILFLLGILVFVPKGQSQTSTEILYSESFGNNPVTRWDLGGNGTTLFPGSLPSNGANANVWSFNSNDPIVALPIDANNLHISCAAGNCGNSAGLTNLVKFNATNADNATNRVAFMKQDFDPATALNGPNLFLTFDFIFQKAVPGNLDAAMRLIYSVDGGVSWNILQTYQGVAAPGVQTANPIPINSSTFAGYSNTLKKLRIGFLWRNKAPATAPNPAIDNGILIDNIVIYNQSSLVLNSVSPNNLCTGARTSINFTATGFNNGTVFSAQLSDPGGNFGNPFLLANVTPGIAQVTIPNGLTTSTNYKIRIVTDNGVVSNEIPVTITKTPDRPFAGGDVADCHGKNVTIGGGAAEAGVTYSWNNAAFGANLAPSVALSNQGLSPTKQTFILFATRASCISRDTVVVTANPNPVVSAGVALSICDNEDPIPLTGSPATTTSPTADPKYIGVWTGPGLNGSGNNTTFNPSGLTGGQTLTYTVSATYSTGGPACEARDTRTITVKQSPTVEAGDNETYCSKATPQNWAGTFTPAGGTWTGPGVSPNGVFNPQALIPGNYICTYSYTNNGCTATDTRNVVITPPPVVNAGLDTLTLCSYRLSYTMTGFSPPAETFGKWTSKPDPTLIQTGGSLTFDTTDVGSHKLYYTYDKDKCKLVDSVTLIILYTPVARSGPSLEVCGNDSCFSITGQYPSGGKWTGVGVDTSGTVFCPTSTTPGTKLLKYRVNYASGCFSEANRVVVVKPAPIINVGKNDTICSGRKSLTMTAFSPPGGIWSGPGITPAGLFQPGDSIFGNVTVRYTVSNASNCTAFKQKQISIYPAPVASAGLDTATCTGSPLRLGSDSVAHLVYKWFEPIPNTIIVDTQSYATIVLVNPKTVIDSFNVRLLAIDTITKCETRDTVKVKVYPRPKALAVFPGIKELCAGDSFMLTAIQKPNYTYEWLRNGISQNIPSIDADTFFAKNSGLYRLVVRNLGFECPDTSLKDSLVINPRFVPSILGNLRFCKDSTTELKVSPIRPGFTYEWQYNRKNVPDANDTTFVIGKTGTVRVILKTDKGCQDSSRISVIDSLPFPKTGILNDTVICEGQVAQFKAPQDSLYFYRWIDSSTNNVISTNDTLFTRKQGKYYLQIYNFCNTVTDSVNLLRINPLPRFGILNNGRSDTIVCVDLPVKLFGPLGYKSYVWTSDSAAGGSGRLYNVSTQDTLSFRLALRVTDQFECSSTDTITVKVQECPSVLYVPTAFSPQGDKVNDLWRLTGYAIDEIKVYIYNRWGQMVFFSDKLDTPWDGAYKGTPCPSGAYKYVIEYKGSADVTQDLKRETGTITILR